MKRRLASLLLAVLTATRGALAGEAAPSPPVAAIPPVATNPILAGDWSDPGLIKVGDYYYTVRSTFGSQPGLPVARSRDLMHWEYIGHAFASHPKLRPGDTRLGVWGSEIGYNPNTRQFLIYAPVRQDYELFVFSAADPAGPYAMKSLGTQRGIDPGFFADTDGRLYLVTSLGIIHELTPDGLDFKGEAGRIDRTRYRLFEGPAIVRHGDWYYLTFSDGGTLPNEPSTISTLRARSLAGPWEEDPGNPVMFSTGNGARFQAPAHGTLVETAPGRWHVVYHAHETDFFSLGRQTLAQPVEWTPDGWWRPVTGKVPTDTFSAPPAPAGGGAPARLAQSDEFDAPKLGLQWFFTTQPDFSGATWTLAEKPGALRVRTPPGDLGAVTALPAIFQQRVTDKRFSVETKLTFDARAGREAAGLHFYHDPQMNFWLTSTVQDGVKEFAVGKYNLGRRADLWSAPNTIGDTVHLKITVDGAEGATFHYGPDGRTWTQLGERVYFGASGHFLRPGARGDPDLGWVGRYKETGAPAETPDPRLPDRRGNTWTAATFGVFAVRDGAPEPRAADFDYLRVVPAAP